MTDLSMVRLIAEREVTTRLRDRTFLLSTLFLLLIVGASVTVPLIIQSRNSCPAQTVAAVGSLPTTVVQRAADVGRAACAARDAQDAQQSDGGSAPSRLGESGVPASRVTVRTLPDLAAAETAILDGSVDAAVVAAPAGSGGSGVQLVGGSRVPDEIAGLVARADAEQRLGSALADSGVDLGAVRQALEGSAPTQRLIKAGADRYTYAIVLGLVFSTLFFLTVFTFGMTIAQSVTEEKQSRIVELLVSAVPVRALLIGKVLGNTVLALGQIVLIMAVGLAGVSIAGRSALVGLILGSGGWFLLFFVGGFVMLACLWAAAGALAGRQEDLQATTVPMQFVVMVPFFASTFVIEPGQWMTVLSYIPFSAPLTMRAGWRSVTRPGGRR
jgi:ABC-2 type transport system permease protein